MATIGDIFGVLKSRTRRDILRLLMKREMHLSGIARELGISVPQASKHCSLLEEKGLVERRVFGRTSVFRARPERIYELLDFFAEEVSVEVEEGTNVLDALKQVANVKVERVGARGFVVSIDGEDGYYVYEVNGRLPEVPMHEFRLKEDVTVELKKVVNVPKKRMRIRVRKAKKPG
ncbi:MAG: metalloregulator ArsR/SmtB family transcription factor [Euryarchaeota archaeon]|nr:metalloregulator ArsR/SmtB family transcription factor [Euryarchaeota archaeon]